MSQLSGSSDIANTPAILGESTADHAAGVEGKSKTWGGVMGHSETASGVYGSSKAGNGVHGQTEKGYGVFGQSNEGGAVVGISKKWIGVYGKSESPTGTEGVRGEGIGVGVAGFGQTWHGVYGKTNSSTGGAGVCGEHTTAIGVRGNSESGDGVRGKSASGRGVWASSESGEGVRAETNSATVAALAAKNLNPNGTGAAIYAEKKGTVGHAGYFIGDVHITKTLVVDGDIVLSNADCAEEFDVVKDESVEPGMVMVLGVDGILEPCQVAYDKRVAGVISGAGAYKPGIVLDKQQSSTNRQPIALMGKVYCMVDADYGAITAGDLLTSSDTVGHAMRADDPFHAFGAVIGKALQSLTSGRGLIPVLVSNR